MTYPLLLDEMFSDAIAEQLRERQHDVVAVVASPTLVTLPDDQILTEAATAGRALAMRTSVREQAAWALGGLGDTLAVPLLLPRLDDSRPLACSAALWALGLLADL